MGEKPVEPPGKPPVGVAHKCHRGWHKDHAHDGGVDADAHHLDDGIGAGDETEKDTDHDHRGSGDHLGGGAEALDDAVDVGVATVVLLTDAGEDEDLVVHREPEQKTATTTP